MEAVQALTGQGGWPMTVFLTPDGRPFFGGTYFPSTRRGGMIAFPELCRRIDELWRTRRPDVDSQAGQLTAALGRSALVEPADGSPGGDALESAVKALRQQHDDARGGFGGAPKFPQAMSLDLLLRAVARQPVPDADIQGVVETSLDAMASGGIYDHLGGGFAALLGRCRVVGAALREDALRPGTAGPRLPARLAGPGPRALPAGARRDRRVRAPGPPAPRGGVPLRRGRGQRGRGGPLLRLDTRPGRRGTRRGPGPGRRGHGLLRRDPGRQLRGPDHPQPHPRPQPGRRRPRPPAPHRGGARPPVRRPGAPGAARPRRQGPDRVERPHAGGSGRGGRRHRPARLARCRRGHGRVSAALAAARGRSLAALVAGRRGCPPSGGRAGWRGRGPSGPQRSCKSGKHRREVGRRQASDPRVCGGPRRPRRRVRAAGGGHWPGPLDRRRPQHGGRPPRPVLGRGTRRRVHDRERRRSGSWPATRI